MLQTYITREEALEEEKNLVGWKSEVIKIYWDTRYDISDERGYRWAIRCNESKYLLTDGFVA